MAIYIFHTLFELNLVEQASPYATLVVRGISADSRKVVEGDLFIGRDGVAHRGIDYIAQAAEKGAIAAVVDANTTTAAEREGHAIPVVAIPNLAYRVGLLASQMLGEPSKKLTMIGITGTNGKTSCAHYIAQSLALLGKKTAIIGTVGNGFPGDLQPATHTTPDAVSLQRLLADFCDQGAKAVVMEVSSHALDQGRVHGVAFDAVALTNLSRDHLDYHVTMQAYGEAKRRLFTEFADAVSVINLDDAFGNQLAAELSNAASQLLTYSQKVSADIRMEEGDLSQQGIALAVKVRGQRIAFNTPVLGEFNIANLLLTTGVLAACGYSAASIESVMSQLSAVPGRMEYLSADGMSSAVVDYAHTPDALEKALLGARRHCHGKLWVVFGCGGDRDTGKRAEMAAVAEQYADQIIVTSDNPRTENPAKIIDMIFAGFSAPIKALREEDREQAIRAALSEAKRDDLVVIAGKGHEDYQDICGVKYPFSDQQVVLKVYQEGMKE
jgi:UDP-N-acetylmuramoyl-L-alanyl-D-glutamate--2,6-diaminopimelate ligase